jgi:hypothetical protein
MKDHAQAKIELINAALRFAEVNVKAGKPLDAHQLATFSLLRMAAREFKETKEAKRVDENGNEFDSLHGTG